MYEQIIIYHSRTGLGGKKINEQLSEELCVCFGGKVTK